MTTTTTPPQPARSISRGIGDGCGLAVPSISPDVIQWFCCSGLAVAFSDASERIPYFTWMAFLIRNQIAIWRYQDVITQVRQAPLHKSTNNNINRSIKIESQGQSHGGLVVAEVCVKLDVGPDPMRWKREAQTTKISRQSEMEPENRHATTNIKNTVSRCNVN